MKQILLAIALLGTSTLGAAAQTIPLAQLSSYLNDLRRAQADFTQFNSDGSVSEGTLYLQRPGRMRFEYGGDASDLLVIAGGGQVAIFDGRSNGPPEQYPLRRTPLHLILAPEVDLEGSGMVIGHSGDATATRVVARDPETPEIGTITLVFTPNPVQLREWIITDETGGETRVRLSALDPDARIGARLFNIVQEMQSRGMLE